MAGEEGMDDVLFGDFLAPAGQRAGYSQIEDREGLQRALQATLSQCNDELGGGMNLVLFKAAVTHLARIVRILRQDNSNLLLIGVGGVGRQSLTRLAAYHLNYTVRTVQLSKSYGVTQWREDVRDVLMECGLSLKPQVFLLSDQHIFSDMQLEDISILLNTCDLQQLYGPDDMAKIQDSEATMELVRRREL